MNGLPWIILFMVAAFTGGGLIAATIFLRLYFRRMAERLDMIVISRSGTFLFLVGLFNFILWFGLAIGLSKLPPLNLITLAILILIGCLMVVGLAGRMRVVGHDVLTLGNSQDDSELKQILVGGTVLSVIFFIPFLGQIFWTILLLQCFGTGLMWIFRRQPASSEPDVTAPINFKE